MICIIFLAIASIHGFKVTLSTWGQSYNTIPVRKGIFYLSFSLAAIPSIIHIIVHMIELKVGDHLENDIRFEVEEQQEGGIV